jgi:hypothetical protein
MPSTRGGGPAAVLGGKEVREQFIVKFTDSTCYHALSRSYHVPITSRSSSFARAHAREPVIRLLRSTQGALSPWAGALGWRGRRGQPLRMADDAASLLLLVTQRSCAPHGWSLTPLTTRSDTGE